MDTEVINIKLQSNAWKKKSTRYEYIGRPTIFGNLFTHLKFLQFDDLIVARTQAEAAQLFEEWLYGRLYPQLQQQRRKVILRALPSLAGKFLGCYCEPQPCHGHVYKEMLDKGYEISVNGQQFVWKP